MRSNPKENFEIRFFLKPESAKRLLALWKNEKRIFKPYSLVDYYFSKGKSQAKVRRWNSDHTPRNEIIFFERKQGLKKEKSQSAPRFHLALMRLRDEGFRSGLRICKKRAWLVSKKGMPTYAIEYIPGLGWTGEIEVPKWNRKKIPPLMRYLERFGASSFTTKSMLQIMQERQRGSDSDIRRRKENINCRKSSETQFRN